MLTRAFGSCVLTRAFALQEETANLESKKEISVEKKKVLNEQENKDKSGAKKKSAADGAYPDAEVTLFQTVFPLYFD